MFDRNAYQRKWAREHRSAANDYRNKNREQYRASARRYNWRKRGAEAPTRQRPPWCEVAGCQRRAVCADHNHKTGKFRGWVCRQCNGALGMISDNPAIALGLARFLKRAS